MKVLMVYNYYKHRRPKISDADMKIKGSFESAFENNPEHTYEILNFGFEPNDIKDAKTLNEEILKRDFDICVVAEELNFYITLDTAKKLGKKLFLIIWDIWIAIAPHDDINFRLACKSVRKWGEHFSPHSILELSQYCNILINGYGEDEILDNVYGLLNTVDTRIYKPDFDSLQTIDIGHNGTLYIPERMKYYEIFKRANVNVTYTGNNPGISSSSTYLSEEEYAENFRKTKISLCYSESPFGPYHKDKKGRVSEIAACGGFMLMTHPHIFYFKGSYHFEPGVHFDSINEADCVDKVKYYLSNPEKRLQMAKAFYDRWMETVGPKAYWEKIFKWSK